MKLTLDQIKAAARGVAELLKDIAGEIGNALFVDCVGFIPQKLAFYSPDGTHPNDEGFRHFADCLIGTLKEQGNRSV